MKLHIAFNISTTIFRSSKYLRRTNLWNFKKKNKKAHILSSILQYVLEEPQLDKSICVLSTIDQMERKLICTQTTSLL